MPLSAAFCFFSPFHYKKKLLYQSFSPHLSSFSSPILLHFGETSFGTYIRNLAHYTIKYNKKSGDLHGKSQSPINTLYKIIYRYEEVFSSIV